MYLAALILITETLFLVQLLGGNRYHLLATMIVLGGLCACLLYAICFPDRVRLEIYQYILILLHALVVLPIIASGARAAAGQVTVVAQQLTLLASLVGALFVMALLAYSILTLPFDLGFSL